MLNHSHHLLADPESLDWNLFDDKYRQELDKRPYVSPSRDRREGSSDRSASDATTSTADSNLSNSTENTKERGQTFADEQDLEFDEAASDEEDAEIPEGSMFDYNIPGVLSKDEVKRLDLDHWRLLVRNALIELEVCDKRSRLSQRVANRLQDLRGWEEWEIDDPGSIKGIAAELIGATGPKLLQNSALVLF